MTAEKIPTQNEQNEQNGNEKKKIDWLPVLSIGLRLLLICAIVAGIISFVYSITLPKVEENMRAKKRTAIIDIFADESLTYEEGDTGCYFVYGADGGLIGYCVETTGSGFGGDLSLMVGFASDRSVLGVRVVSHSETPGLGARVDDNNYLAQYTGKSGKLELGQDIDAISGATISSRAVLSAVNAASARLEESMAIPAEGGTNP